MNDIPPGFGLDFSWPKAEPTPELPAAHVFDPRIKAVLGNRTVPLSIDKMTCIHTSAERYEHCRLAIEAAQRYQFPVLVGPGNAQPIDRPCLLVGSGPSALAMLPEIRERYDKGSEIFAVKGAHDWLVKNGIIPHAAIALDPRQSCAKCFKRRTEGVLYMLASQMHPDTWSYMRKQRVLIWHSRIGVEQEKRPGWERTFLVPNCSHTGSSAILLLYLMGRRSIDAFGFDSSLPPLPTGIFARTAARVFGRQLKLDGARVPDYAKVMEVEANGKRFHTTTALVAQVEEILRWLNELDDLKFRAHGRGYLQAVLEA